MEILTKAQSRSHKDHQCHKDSHHIALVDFIKFMTFFILLYD